MSRRSKRSRTTSTRISRSRSRQSSRWRSSATLRSRRFARPCAPATRRPRSAQRMLRKPPHVLVTTPESLFILLTAERSRRLFAGVSMRHRRRDPRDGRQQARLASGADARAARRSGRRAAAARAPQRIGLSATVRPLDEVARFLSPRARDRRRRPSARDGARGRGALRRARARSRAKRCGARSTIASPSRSETIARR